MRPPTTNPITQGKHGKYVAVDYSAKPDPYIYAPESGTVTFYANSGDCGNNLQYEGASGYRHGFCHLEKSLVKVGQKITKGQKIGVMGYTGLTNPKGSAGAHLHWVLRKGNTYYYPPSKVTEPFKGEEMHAGKTAVEWYKVAAKYMTEIKKRDKSIAALKTALANEKNKPAEVVVKEVEKIVEKIVEVPVKVGEEEAVRGFFGRLLDLIFKKG